MTEIEGKELIPGIARAHTMTLGTPLSLWDGLDSKEGIIIQPGHTNEGQSIAGTILIFSSGFSGATAGAALTDCFRTKSGPAALVLPAADAIVVTAIVVAQELYGKQIPVLQIEAEDMMQIPNGVKARIENNILILD